MGSRSHSRLTELGRWQGEGGKWKRKGWRRKCLGLEAGSPGCATNLPGETEATLSPSHFPHLSTEGPA